MDDESNKGRDEQGDKESFEQALRQSTPRVFITPTLIAINGVVFAAMVATGVSVFDPNIESLINWGANFGPATIGYGEWWRLLTCNFLHIGLFHLAFNMWVLWDIGRMAERMFGNWTFLIIYVLSGLGGSVASLLWNPRVVSAGASGAVFGIIGGIVAFMALSRATVPRTVITGHLRSLLLFAGYNLFYGFVRTGIDNAGHIGGLVMGLALGALLRRAIPSVGRLLWRRQVAVILGTLALIFAGITQGGQRANDPLVRMGTVENLMASDSFEEALAEVEEILAGDLDDDALAMAYTQRGRVCFLLERHEEAVESFRRSLQIDAEQPVLLPLIALSLALSGDIDGAKKAFEESIANGADAETTALAGRTIGGTLVLGDRDSEAIDILERSAQLTQTPGIVAEVWLFLGTAYGAQRRHDESIAAYERSLELQPGQAIAYGNMGWEYYVLGEFEKCIEMSRKGIELDDTQLYTRYNIALAHLRMRDVEEATSLYRETVELNRGRLQDISPGAIQDLQDLIDAGIMADEAQRILTDVFGVEETGSR